MRMESPLNQRLRWSPPDVVYTPIDVTSSFPSCGTALPPPLHLDTSPPTSVPSDNGPPELMPQQRAGVLSAAATVHVGEYAGLCLFLPGMMPSAPPVYPLDAIPLETVDRSSDALQLHELASAWTVCQTAARCFVVLLFANGISWALGAVNDRLAACPAHLRCPLVLTSGQPPQHHSRQLPRHQRRRIH